MEDGIEDVSGSATLSGETGEQQVKLGEAT
jgi:hypothetical protein